MKNKVFWGGVAILTALTAPGVGHAQQSGAQSDDETIVVTGSRLSDAIQTFPGSYTVIGDEAISEQLATTRDLASVLSFSVPGLAQGNGTAANVEQSLRGRPVRLFVDGIPISNPLRDGGRDVRLIAPSALDRIEVVRGSSSLYGQGGAGGVINYITKRGARSDDWRFRTEVGTGVSLTHASDSWRPYVFQSATGGLGPFDINVNGSYEQVSGQYDANGERLPPDPNLFGGIADSDIFNFFGKVGLDVGRTQRFELMVNSYNQTQETDYVFVAGDIATLTPTTATEAPSDPRALDQENENFVSYLAYSNSDVLGSSLRAQIYHVENRAIFSFEPARLGGTQTSIDSEKTGFQIDIRTPVSLFAPGGVLLWGVDLARDVTEQPLIPLTAIDGRTFSPPMEQNNVAVFAQLELPLTERLTLRAGVRHDDFTLNVDDFVAGLTNVPIQGGELSYDATPINIGGTFELTDNLQLFGGFSQGFSVPDVGLPLRRAGNGVANVSVLRPAAAVADNYEIGLRGAWDHFNFAVAYFLNQSDIGTDFVIDASNPTEVTILREKERIQGVEFALGGDFGDDTRWGLNYSWSEGERDANRDGSVDTPLTGRRIPPSQFNAFIEHDIAPWWMVRMQLAHTGDRNEFPNSPIGRFYEGRVRATTRIDAMTSFDLGSADLSIGVNNLLNDDYFTATSQLVNRNDRFSKAEGRTLYVRYGVNY